jgi:hypothetical protein
VKVATAVFAWRALLKYTRPADLPKDKLFALWWARRLLNNGSRWCGQTEALHLDV